MAQTPTILQVTVSSAGTRQRVVTNEKSANRFVKSAYFRAREINSGTIFIGDSTVSSTKYTERLLGSEKTALSIEGDTMRGHGSGDEIDLYNTWVDASTNGDVVFVTILRP